MPDIGLPDWEVVHAYQDERVNAGLKTILLLRRTTSTGEPFAVSKTFSEALNDDNNEANMLNQIPPHPNIIKLYSTHDDLPCAGNTSLILEFCAGKDLLALKRHASKAGKHLPEEFLWHVLYQILLALKHLNQCHIVHSDLHLGNIFLRPVGDLYPDVVLADFEYSEELGKDDSERRDMERLGNCIYSIVEDDTAPYGQELRDFVEVMCGVHAGKHLPPRLCSELEHDLIPLAKKMAYGDNQTATNAMPTWMLAYFNELKSVAETAKSQTSGSAKADDSSELEPIPHPDEEID